MTLTQIKRQEMDAQVNNRIQHTCKKIKVLKYSVRREGKVTLLFFVTFIGNERKTLILIDREVDM